MRLPELPPRARRIPAIAAAAEQHIGTTSACAENTGSVFHRWAAFWNYLRVRGEYREVIIYKLGKSELPPRARRILLNSIHLDRDLGTTSACAENTRVLPYLERS